ncbi:hypothetical protein C8Q75DRAFT_803614 [Abortiporus biennis]|nr:hypothetical protein C8Q75DRAFT_803614 [Abortiporus biennis]
MDSTTTGGSLLPPNPITPLAFIPPDVALQLTAERHLAMATSGAWMWDALTSFPEDVQLFTTHKLSVSDVVYVCSRLFTMGYIASMISFNVRKVEHCQTLLNSLGAFSALTISSCSLLFLFRARAVFYEQRWLVYIFFIAWVGCLGTSMIIPAAFHSMTAIYIGPTKYCITPENSSLISIPAITLTAYDTVTFIAISVRLLLNYPLLDTSFKGKMNAFLRGQGLGHLTRWILQSGQFYYMIAVTINLVSLIDSLDTAIPPGLRGAFAAPNLVLLNAMAARVYRKTRVGFIGNNDPSLRLRTS